jgi:hypothetical protein
VRLDNDKGILKLHNPRCVHRTKPRPYGPPSPPPPPPKSFGAHLAIVLVVAQELGRELADDRLEVVGSDVGVALLGPHALQQVGVGAGQGPTRTQNVAWIDVPLEPGARGWGRWQRQQYTGVRFHVL